MKTFEQYLCESTAPSAYKKLDALALKLIHDKFGNPLKATDAEKIEEYIWGDGDDIANTSRLLSDLMQKDSRNFDKILKNFDDAYDEYGDDFDEDGESPSSEAFEEATFPILGRVSAAINKELGKDMIQTLDWDI